MVIYTTELTDVNYKSFIKNPLVLVDVYAIWCQPCKQIGPIVDQISFDFVGSLSVGKLDADKAYETVTELGIRSIPTIILYKDGEIVEKVVGLTTKQKLVEMVNKYL